MLTITALFCNFHIDYNSRAYYRLSRYQGTSVKKLSITILAATVLFTASCSYKSENISRKEYNPYWSDLAAFLAGMPVREGSIFAKAALTNDYELHRSWMNKYWDRVQKENIDIIVPWRNANIPASIERNTAFYPLSGADFVNLYTFFPKAERYIMVSLEKQGPIPDPMKLSPRELKQGLVSVRNAIWTIASLNYFVTHIMRSQMNNRYMEGTLPALLIFSSRMGLKVVNVENVTIDAAGTLLTSDNLPGTRGDGPGVNGIRIQFLASGDTIPRDLVYLSMKMCPETGEGGGGADAFLKKLSGINTFMKSAIYLLHEPDFRRTCEFLIGRSSAVLQDDTGMPYCYFSRAQWDIHLYGFYTKGFRLKGIPNPPHQADLATDYLAGSRPLPFNFGYGIMRKDKKSNLMLIVKKNPAS